MDKPQFLHFFQLRTLPDHCVIEVQLYLDIKRECRTPLRLTLSHVPLFSGCLRLLIVCTVKRLPGNLLLDQGQEILDLHGYSVTFSPLTD